MIFNQKTEKASRDGNNNISIVHTLAIIIGVVCLLLLAVIGFQNIPKLWTENPGLATSNTNKENVNSKDLAGQQMSERVEDLTQYLNTTITIIGILVTLVALALGLSIWKTREYATSLLDKHFAKFEREKLEPVVQNKKNELKDVSNKGAQLINHQYELLFKSLEGIIKEEYEQKLEIEDVPEVDIKKEINKKENYFRKSRELTQWLIMSLSRDEEIVEDICDKLNATVKDRGDIVADNKSKIVDHLYEVMNQWPKNSSTRSKLQRTIDKIENV